MEYTEIKLNVSNDNIKEYKLFEGIKIYLYLKTKNRLQIKGFILLKRKIMSTMKERM